MRRKEKNKSFEFILKSSGRYFWLILLLAVLAGVISGSFIVLALFSKEILDAATGVSNGSIIIYAVGIAVIIALQAVFNVIISNIQVMTTGKIEIRIKEKIFEKLLEKKYESISGIHSGEILNRFTSDVSVVSTSLVSIVPYAVSLGVRLIGGLIVLMYIDFKFTFIICGVGVVIGVFSRILSPIFKRFHKRVQETDGFVRSFVQECIENIVVIKSFSSSAKVLSRLDCLQNQNYIMKVKRNAFSNIANTGVYVIFTASYYAALLWGAFGIMNRFVTFGSLTAFLQVIDEVKAPMKNISGLLPQYYQMTASVERILEILDLPEENCEKVYTTDLYKSVKGIVLDGIAFRYKEDYVVENTYAFFEKNRITGISGSSGIGKSTVMKLLLALIEPENGKIYFETENGNIPVSKGTRSLFSYVPQGNMLLSGTIRENIAFGNEDASDEDIRKAAELACAWEFIEKLPQKTDTVIGERGTGLSEGQVQRIALARAFLSNAPIILLDEATSALDMETEKRLLNNIRGFKNKTCIFISHKPAAVEECDVIYRMENGKLRKY